MRILQLHTRYRHLGGEDTVVQAERELLASAGHQVITHHAENPPGAVRAAGALALAPWNPLAARQVLAAVREAKPDVAHVHNTWFALSPAILHTLRRAGVPAVMTVHNYRYACANALFLRDGRPCESCLPNAWPAVRHRCYHSSRAMSAVAAITIETHRRSHTWTRCVSRFIALSDFAQQRLTAFGVPAGQIEVSGNFVPDPGPRLAPPSASTQVLFAGRLSTEKGAGVLLDAWKALASTRSTLLIAGDGPDRERLEAQHVPGVRFAGRLPAAELNRELRRSRALVLPSIWYEGQPMIALEGMAAGTPLIASDIGGLGELMHAGDAECGWRVPPGDVHALTTTLGALTGDAVDTRGRGARARYEQSFTPGTALTRLERILSTAAGLPA